MKICLLSLLIFSLAVSSFAADIPKAVPHAEKQKLDAGKKRLEEQRKLEDEKKKLEEEKRQLAEKQRIEEEKRQSAEKKRLEEEKKRFAEQQKLEDEKKKLEDEKKQLAAERQRVEAEKLHVEKEKKLIADHRAIRELVTAHRTAVLSADLETMLSICFKSYSETSWDGKTRTYDDLLKMVKYYALVRTSDDLEVVMENALLIQGEVISDQLREKAASIKKTEQAKQTIDQIRTTFDSLLAQSSRAIKFITVKNIVINGDTAAAVSEINDPESSKTYPAYYELILHRGKWLVKSVK